MENLAKWKIKELEAYVGGLSNPSKMPGYAYSLPAKECITGSKLREVEDSVCGSCYAMKGFYVFPKVEAALYRRLESLEKPLWVPVMAELITRKSKEPYFRWHDSGDLQGVGHLEKIVNVCRLTPKINHWLPTREYRIVADFRKTHRIPKNLVVRMSAHMIGGKVPSFTKPLTISTVSRDEATYPDAHLCPALHQDNFCGDCRACWDSNVPHVDYHRH